MDRKKVNDLAVASKGDNSIFELLVNEIKPYLENRIKEYRKKYSYIRDTNNQIRSELYFQIINAVNSFDTEKGDFIAWVSKYWRSGMKNLLKKDFAQSRSILNEIYIDDLIELLEGNTTIDDIENHAIEFPERDISIENRATPDFTDDVLENIILNELISRLNNKQKTALYEISLGNSYRIIANKHPDVFSNYKDVERTVKAIRKMAA